MKKKLIKKFENKNGKIKELTNDDMKSIVGSGNNNIHSIPPELFEAMFVNPQRMK